MAFTTSFLSIAGQKERIANVGKVLGIATGVYNPTKTTIVASTPSKTANKVLEVVANHPYATAAVVGSAVNAAKYIPSIVASAASKSPSVIGSSFSAGTKLAVAGAVGLAAGSLFSGSSSSGKQDVNTNQTPKIDVDPNQKTNNFPNTNPNQNDTNSQSGTGNIWYQTKTQNTYSENYNYQNPNQETSPYIPVSQEVSPEQTTTSGSSTNWVTIALIGAGLYFLVKD